MYCEADDATRSKQTMDRCLTAVQPGAPATAAGWYVYAMQSHMKALQHDYAAAVQAYMKGRSLADEKGRERVAEEFALGLDKNEDQANADFDQVPTLLAQGSYAKLDEMADNLLSAKTALSKGSWKLDIFYDKLEGKGTTGSSCRQRVYDLQKWLKQKPKSVAARVGLAKAYTEYAWDARGCGWATSVTDQGW